MSLFYVNVETGVVVQHDGEFPLGDASSVGIVGTDITYYGPGGPLTVTEPEVAGATVSVTPTETGLPEFLVAFPVTDGYRAAVFGVKDDALAKTSPFVTVLPYTTGLGIVDLVGTASEETMTWSWFMAPNPEVYDFQSVIRLGSSVVLTVLTPPALDGEYTQTTSGLPYGGAGTPAVTYQLTVTPVLLDGSFGAPVTIDVVRPEVG